MNISIHIKLLLELYYLLNGKHIHHGYQRSGSKMNVQKKKAFPEIGSRPHRVH